jgi:dATP pyrophosphohydrolase
VSYRPDIVECWVFRIATPGRTEVLLIRRSPGRIFPGLWQCVTGRLDPGERIPLAALREVGEETALSGDDIEAFFDLDLIAQFYDASVDAVMSSVIFAIRVRPGAEPRLSHEHDAFRWVSPEEAAHLAVWPSYDEAIRRIGLHLADPELARWFELDSDGARLAR